MNDVALIALRQELEGKLHTLQEGLRREIETLRAEAAARQEAEAADRPDTAEVFGVPRASLLDAPHGHVARGGVGRMSVEPGLWHWLHGACGAAGAIAGLGEEKEYQVQERTYWENDCLYYDYWVVTIVDGRVLKWLGPCKSDPVVCATDCITLTDPECIS